MHATDRGVRLNVWVGACVCRNSTASVSGGCVYKPAWQGYRCAGLQHHMLVVESLDGDTETRRLSPLALDGGDTGGGNYTDLLNGPMDHGEHCANV